MNPTRKGVGTAMGAVFFISLILTAIVTLIAIDAHQTRYLQAREEMVEWDIKRISESLKITSVYQPSSNSSYKFDIKVNNDGGVFTRIVRIYIYDSTDESLWGIFDRQTAPGESVFAGGEIMPGEGGHVMNINASDTLESSLMYRYRIVICTERGEQFSYDYPVPSEAGGEESSGYAIIIATTHYNFQYNDTISPENFLSAYVKPKDGSTIPPEGKRENTLYRVLLNNTTDKRIYLWSNCTMLQMWSATGQITGRYIVSNLSTSAPDNLISFVNQSETIGPNLSTYVYFAATEVGGVDWQEDPTQGDYIAGFILWFNYEGESEVRSIGLPTLIQRITTE